MKPEHAVSNSESTKFAPAGRSPREVVIEQNLATGELAVLDELLTNVPLPVFVVNADRQLVYCNRALVDMVGGGQEEHLGRRSGEVLGCIHSEKEEGGCGTADACRTCGAVLAVLSALSGEDAEEEVRLTLNSGQSLDLIATARRIRSTAQVLVAVTLRDTSDEKRRQVLERVFFEDIRNIAEDVRDLAGLFIEADSNRHHELVDVLQRSVGHLAQEVRAQKLLQLAEADEWSPDWQQFSICDLLFEAVASCAPLASERDVKVVTRKDTPEALISSDPEMVFNVLKILIRNAIEASAAGMTVLVGALRSGDYLTYSIHNETVMTKETRNQIFQRSFSTRGPGHGVGTYAAKLFGERCLRGEVSCHSSEGYGTRFQFKIPLHRS